VGNCTYNFIMQAVLRYVGSMLRMHCSAPHQIRSRHTWHLEEYVPLPRQTTLTPTLIPLKSVQPLLMFVAQNFKFFLFYIDYRSSCFSLYFWFKEFLVIWCNCCRNLDKLGACDRYQCGFGIYTIVSTH